jgi:rubrerythrin
MSVTGGPGSPGAGVAAIEAARLAEKEQALLYRGLAARAEEDGRLDLAERFHDLHADEQHHLSRLTARLLEMGARPIDLAHVTVNRVAFDTWESTMRELEMREIDRYRELLAGSPDSETRHLVEEILAVERHHAAELGGKWTMA